MRFNDLAIFGLSAATNLATIIAVLLFLFTKNPPTLIQALQVLGIIFGVFLLGLYYSLTVSTKVSKNTMGLFKKTSLIAMILIAIILLTIMGFKEIPRGLEMIAKIASLIWVPYSIVIAPGIIGICLVEIAQILFVEGKK